MKKKLAVVVPSLRGGGAEKVIINILRNIDKNKFDIKLILVKKEGPYVKLIPDDILVSDLNKERVRYSLLKLIKELNEFKPDIIFSTLGHLNIALLSIRKLIKGNPKIIVREANTPSKSISSNKRFLTTLYKYFYPKADLIVAQCKEMKDDIVDIFNIDEKKITYIYNPVDIEGIKNCCKNKNPYNNNKINLLSVGRLTFQKGFDILIDAFNIVLKKIPNAHLTILGEGILKNDLQKQAEILGIRENISFVGFKENPYPYYYYSDVYILSSRWEGFPNTLLEALACGTKVVATDCKSGPKEILAGGKYGVLVNEGDYKSLADGIIKAIIGENKTSDRANLFHIKKIIKEYEKIFLN